jgi:EAL domain-containing protein (putative c-di-GMP-specific phosphodiesterase class I)
MQHLTDSGVRVDQIEFEITEGILIGECAQTAANMRDLRQAGIVFSVDDFGTGFSSLSYLQRFPLSSLKIDRSFVTELPSHADSAILTKAIISMAQQLRMSVVAEGVETPEQLEFLRQAGCDIAQGYLFSRPVPSDRFEQTIRMIERLPKGISSHPKEGTTASGFTEGFGI